ncbi:MAG: ABC transporter ATP-binding protein, partial [Firmicutes bacterium]|nr:ABC transporter ATP-binding protein [Bacillota bacterium]
MPPRGMNRSFLTEEEKANRPKVTLPLLKRVFSYLLPYWKQMTAVLACIVLSSVLSLLPSVLTGRIIDEGLIGRDMRMLVMLISASLGVTLGANLIRVAESYLNNWIAQHITFDMRNKMYRHLQQMPQSFFTSNNQGDIITRMTSDISGVERVVTSTFTSILSNVITLVSAVIIMFRENWVLAAAGALVIP